MCFGGSKKTTTKIVLPEHITEASKDVLRRARELADKPFEPYKGDRVADFSGDQIQAFEMLRNLIANAPDVLGESLQGARAYASAPAQHLATERLVDESGRLGAIEDYVNPYVKAALQPTLRAIQDQAAAARKRIASNATSAGAFGDARHGILEARLNQDTATAMGDTASKFYMDAFERAMGRRESDLNRMTEIDKLNAAFVEQALERMFAGSGALLDRASQDQTNQLERIRALLSAGAMQQGLEQAELDAAYEEFLRKYGHDFNLIEMLSSALGGVPYDKTQITKQPNNSLFGTIGSALGSFLGTETGAGAVSAGIGALASFI